MKTSPPLVTIFGGSGFVGRYITHRLARSGWRVRVAVRRPNEAIFVKQFGEVGQVEPILANVRDEASTRAAIRGADAVINCVGILHQSGAQRFDALHNDAAARIAKAAAEEGVAQFIHLSSIGADAESLSHYARSKAAGETAVREAFPSATILRPSVVFGTEDSYFNRFAGLSRMIPLILPLVGANTKFQPVYVEDIAKAVDTILSRQIAGQTMELGGPDIASFRELMEKMLHVTRRKRYILNLPLFVARAQALLFEVGSFLTGGLFAPALTRDQIAQLQVDNVVNPEMDGFAQLGIAPTAMDGVLNTYLYSYRPKGQFTDLLTAKSNLRG